MLKMLPIILLAGATAFAELPEVAEAKAEYAKAVSVADIDHKSTLDELALKRDTEIDTAKIDLITVLREVRVQLTKAGLLDRAVQADELIDKLKVKSDRELVKSRLPHMKAQRAIREYNKIVTTSTITYEAEAKQANQQYQDRTKQAKNDYLKKLNEIKGKVAQTGNLDAVLEV